MLKVRRRVDSSTDTKTARWRVTKEALAQISEYLTSALRFAAPTTRQAKEPAEGDRQAFLAIESKRVGSPKG